MDFFVILLSTVLVNNFVLTQFLGLSTFMAVSSKLETAVGVSAATVVVLTLTSIGSHLIDDWILEPLGLPFLRTITFLLLIAAVTQLTRVVAATTSPLLYGVLTEFPLLIIGNTAVLGAALQNSAKLHTLSESALYGLGAAAGFSLVLVLFAALRERLDAADVPRPLRGAAVNLITAGLMSLAFMGFVGL